MKLGSPGHVPISLENLVVGDFRTPALASTCDNANCDRPPVVPRLDHDSVICMGVAISLTLPIMVTSKSG